MKSNLIAGLLACACFVSSANAQDAGSAAPAFSDPMISSQSAGKAFPTVFGASSAFSAPGGTVFGSVTYVNPRGGKKGNGADGDLAFGAAFGNPINSVGVTAGVDITSTHPSDFGDSGGLSLSLSRALHVSDNGATFVGLSTSNQAAWGDSKADPEQYTGTVSHLTSVGAFPVMVTGGYSTNNTYDKKSNKLEDGAFAGVGVGLTPNVSASLSATKTQLNAGVSASVPGLDGVSVSTGYYDVTDNVNRRQFSLSIGISKSGLFGK